MFVCVCVLMCAKYVLACITSLRGVLNVFSFFSYLNRVASAPLEPFQTPGWSIWPSFEISCSSQRCTLTTTDTMHRQPNSLYSGTPTTVQAF